MKQTEILTHAIHANGWFPAVCMNCMSQNFRLFHVSNLSVRNFRIFLLMYTGSLSVVATAAEQLLVILLLLHFIKPRTANGTFKTVCKTWIAFRSRRSWIARPSSHPSAMFRPCLQPPERVPARSSGDRKQGRNSADGCGEDRV